MIFISFIENAYKHSTNKKIDNAISVEVFINKGNIIFLCENKFDITRKFKNESDGLNCLKVQK